MTLTCECVRKGSPAWPDPGSGSARACPHPGSACEQCGS